MGKLHEIYSKARLLVVTAVRALAVIAGLILTLILWGVLKILFLIDEITQRKSVRAKG